MPNSGGGGPSPNANGNIVILPTRQASWTVARAASRSWMVSSTEQFTGIDSTIGGKQFTGITHLGDNGYALSDHLNVTWVRQGVTTTLNGVWIASCQITGKLTTTVNNNGTGNVDPNDIFTDMQISNSKDWAPKDIW